MSNYSSFLSFFFALILPPMQELERSALYTRSLGKRDLIDPLRLGKDGGFAAALATAVAASVAAESAAQAAQAAVDSRTDDAPNKESSGSKRSRRHAAHAQAHAAAAVRASGAATLAAAQAIQLASKAGPSRAVTGAAKTAPISTSAPSSGKLVPPMTSPIRSARPSSQQSPSSLVASPEKKDTFSGDTSQSAMASPLFGGDGDDDDSLGDLDGGDYVAKWEVQR